MMATLPNRNYCSMTYVCLLSEYTVASAQAVRLYKPDQVIAISSPFVHRKSNDTRFAKLLAGWGHKVEVFGNGNHFPDPFPAESHGKSQEWLKTYLEPILKKAHAQNHRLFANLTGGTKAAAIALKECRNWEELHYTAEGTRNQIEVFNKGIYSLDCLDLLEEASLLIDGAKIIRPTWGKIDNDYLQNIAEVLFNDCRAGKEKSVINANERLLRALWFKKASAECMLDEYGVRQKDQMAIIPPGKLAELFTKMGNCGCDDIGPTPNGGWRLPVSNRHPWARFISGGWWEYLVAEWLREAGLDFVPNVVVPRRSKGPYDSEADILVRSQSGVFCAIECKVQPPSSAGFGDMVKLLKELGDRFGKTRKGFAVSPAFWWQVKASTRHDFEDACELRNIDMLTSREEIKQWLA